MRKTVLTEEAGMTLKRLESKDPGLKQLLKQAYGYAVFPSVGKAAAVLGGAYGHGVVFQQGKRIGYATISQMTVGVQIGGDTFSEVLIFRSRQAIERFKRGKMAWAANASAVLVAAGAGGTADHEKDVTALAYSRGGMMLELAIGGQKFKFRPLGGSDGGSTEEGGAEAEDASSGDESSEEDNGATGALGRAVGGVREAASKAGSVARQHPVLTSIAGASLAAGLALVVARAVRQSSGQNGESDTAEGEYDDENDESDRGEDDEADESEESSASSESEGEEEEQDETADDEETEDQPVSRRGRRRPARARA